MTTDHAPDRVFLDRPCSSGTGVSIFSRRPILCRSINLVHSVLWNSQMLPCLCFWSNGLVVDPTVQWQSFSLKMLSQRAWSHTSLRNLYSFLSFLYYSHAHKGHFFPYNGFRFPKSLYPLPFKDLINCFTPVVEVTALTALTWGEAGPSWWTRKLQGNLHCVGAYVANMRKTRQC